MRPCRTCAADPPLGEVLVKVALDALRQPLGGVDGHGHRWPQKQGLFAVSPGRQHCTLAPPPHTYLPPPRAYQALQHFG